MSNLIQSLVAYINPSLAIISHLKNKSSHSSKTQPKTQPNLIARLQAVAKQKLPSIDMKVPPIKSDLKG
jgi:hypothetical protein